MNLPKPFIKLVVPAAGTFGLYAGGLLGVLLAARGGQAAGFFAAFFWAAALSSALGFAALLGAEKALGPEAAFIDTLKTLFYMGGAALLVFVQHVAGDRWLGHFLPAFLENLLIWAAGVASIWEEEPGFVSWKTAIGSLRDPRPR